MIRDIKDKAILASYSAVQQAMRYFIQTVVNNQRVTVYTYNTLINDLIKYLLSKKREETTLKLIDVLEKCNMMELSVNDFKVFLKKHDFMNKAYGKWVMYEDYSYNYKHDTSYKKWEFFLFESRMPEIRQALGREFGV
jgi:IS1 family transposase